MFHVQHLREHARWMLTVNKLCNKVKKKMQFLVKIYDFIFLHKRLENNLIKKTSILPWTFIQWKYLVMQAKVQPEKSYELYQITFENQSYSIKNINMKISICVFYPSLSGLRTVRGTSWSSILVYHSKNLEINAVNCTTKQFVVMINYTILMDMAA